ncbi:uncharacterized protein cubi_01800 [Cryptosporidium ubiquitum]|uniref:Uncharacterized protein n=1 Tax=Cryptosporidium ubiquitum TaxID=857276 RepID=A0A1J4MEN5_9CRYT|nr:uncharacterized protein cubi_01800 [Cryptosporidium ubiquitum]OII71325.1 hypothetical protein cubi_01800 [Cryptosporidium ubiquitum]
MTILFLSSYSSSTISEINKKKGYISYLIFPFIKIYKKSILHIAKINGLNNSKIVLNLYDNKKDIYFIIKLLKYIYIKEQNINRKKWITNQIKKITCFQEYTNESNSGLGTSALIDKKENLKNYIFFEKADIIPTYEMIIPRKNNIETLNFYWKLQTTKNNKLVSLNKRLGFNKHSLRKYEDKGLIESIFKMNDKKDVYQYSCFAQNSNKWLPTYSSIILSPSFKAKNLMLTKPNIKGIQRKNYMENNKLLLINHSSLSSSNISAITDVNPNCNKGKIVSPEKKCRSKFLHVRNLTNIFGEAPGGIMRWSNCNERKASSRIEHGKMKPGKLFFSRANLQQEKVFENDETQRIRLNGPFGYKLVN